VVGWGEQPRHGTQLIKPLTAKYYEANLEPWLSRVLNRDDGQLDWRRPFTEAFPHRAILFPVAFDIPEQVFANLSKASAKDEEFVLSWLDRFFSESEPIQMDWSLSSADYEEYRRAASVPVDQALYSLSANWAIVLTDEYGVVGTASPLTLAAIEEAAGQLADPWQFILEVKSVGMREGFAVSESWTTELLKHVLGPTRAAELIHEAS